MSMKYQALLVGLLLTTAIVLAHEGHKPLPTRGMEVNPETGRMTLTDVARSILDVQTTEIGPQNVSPALLAYGTLVSPWDHHALVSTPLSGRIVDLLVTPGETVHAGQVLAALESPDLEALQLEVRSAQTSLDLAVRLFASTEVAAKSGAIPEVRLIEARNQVQLHRAAVEIARAKWRSLQLPEEDLEQMLRSPADPRPQKLSLLSPISGTVTHSDLSVGKVVNAREHLFEVLDLSEVWLKVGVLEKDLSRVSVGQSLQLRLTAWPDLTLDATVDVLGQRLDPVTHLGTVWATLSNNPSVSPLLIPGMSGQVALKIGDVTAGVAVPADAVIRDGAERFVLVEQERTQAISTFQKQTVALGQRVGPYIELRAGSLFPGDRVVTQGSHQLGGYFTQGVLRVSDETARDIGLDVQPAAETALSETITVDGIVDVPPARRTIASAQLGGTIARILTDRAQHVQAGQVLAEIISQEFQNLQLELLRAHLDAELQQEVITNLGEAGDAISQRRLWEAEAKLQQASGVRASLRQRLLIAGVNASQVAQLESTRELMPTLPVIAPISGVVMDFDKILGHIVQPDEPVFEIHDLSAIWIQGFVSERDLAQVEIGQTVRVRLVSDASEPVTGTVVRSSRTIGTEDRTTSIWVELKSRPRVAMLHNMMARLSIETTAARKRLAVPRSAVVREGIRSYVFVQTEDGTFERRLVELGISNDLFVEVTRGLSVGDLTAIAGASALQTGYAALK